MAVLSFTVPTAWSTVQTIFIVMYIHKIIHEFIFSQIINNDARKGIFYLPADFAGVHLAIEECQHKSDPSC
jgi:hypothetical protein